MRLRAAVQIAGLMLAAAIAAPRSRAAAAPKPVAAGGAEEVRETYMDAFREFREGRYESAARGYRYLVSLGAKDAAPAVNLALMMRDSGNPEAAAAHWLKASLIDPKDAFIWSQRGWNYLALGLFREARDSFRKAVETAANPAESGEAYFGLGLSESLDGNPKSALTPLTAASQRNPYVRPAAEAELARAHVRMRRHPEALPPYTTSLSQDEMQLDVAREIGRAYEKTGQPKAAWQAYKLALDLDPDDADSARRKEKLEKYIEGRPEENIPLLRLARPMLRSVPADSAADRAGPPLRVAMFTGARGRPRHLTKMYVMGSTTTVLWDVKLEEEPVAPATAFQQWEVTFRPDSRVIEIRDNAGRIIYVTKQPFQLQPRVPGYTVLIKSPQMTDIRGINLSDRELRGRVEVIPTPEGFHIVNEIPLEEYLFSILGRNVPEGSPPEAYKAMAVLWRTKMRRVAARRPGNAEKTHLCDSSFCVEYFGLSRERTDGTEAVRATRGIALRPPAGFTLESHKSCGGATAAGLQDRSPPIPPLRGPAEFERTLHDYPDNDLFHQSSALVPEHWNRWVRIIDARDLRSRIERSTRIGWLKNAAVKRRDATGRVLELELVGAKGSLTLSGLSEISRVLLPGSIRSTMFTIQPIYKRRRLDKLILWGAGTGEGRGVCVAGAMGQAHEGRSFSTILRHYFTTKLLFDGFVHKEPPKPRAVTRDPKLKYRPRGRRARPPRLRRRP